MMGSESVFFDAGAFIGGLFLLEFGADKFIDHTAVIAKRLGISPTLIALLTAGAEWEEV
jgi:Ca2+/Na+ antiporter